MKAALHMHPPEGAPLPPEPGLRGSRVGAQSGGSGSVENTSGQKGNARVSLYGSLCRSREKEGTEQSVFP